MKGEKRRDVGKKEGRKQMKEKIKNAMLTGRTLSGFFSFLGRQCFPMAAMRLPLFLLLLWHKCHTFRNDFPKIEGHE